MEETIFEACQDHAEQAMQYGGVHEVVAAVIETLIKRTPSPRCAEELTRILREGGVEVAEATFD